MLGIIIAKNLKRYFDNIFKIVIYADMAKLQEINIILY